MFFNFQILWEVFWNFSIKTNFFNQTEHFSIKKMFSSIKNVFLESKWSTRTASDLVFVSAQFSARNTGNCSDSKRFCDSRWPNWRHRPGWPTGRPAIIWNISLSKIVCLNQKSFSIIRKFFQSNRRRSISELSGSFFSKCFSWNQIPVEVFPNKNLISIHPVCPRTCGNPT